MPISGESITFSPMSRRIRSVAIIGGGPAGASLGATLARSGIKTVIFQSGQRPELIVGESLVPAVVPHLQRLGVEKAVAEFSTFKPGATVTLGEHGNVSFDFGIPGGSDLPYAYNTPRAEFDTALLDAARGAGATIIDQTAELASDGASVRLTGGSADAAEAALGGLPGFIVDASGRSRRIARLLALPAVEGDRKDISLFAHMDRGEIVAEGHIHIDRYERGWGWRIPLPGRISVGIVVDGKHLGEGSKEDRFDRFASEEPALKRFLTGSKRLTGVMQYTNYQWVSEQWTGPNWALLGDAGGFVDPIFSTGVGLALTGAARLAKALQKGSPGAIAKYGTLQHKEIEDWKRIISYWYDGRLFTLFRVGRDRSDSPIGRFVNPHVTKHLSRIFTGEAGEYSYSRWLLHTMVEHSLTGYDSDELRIN